ncbi:S-layer homology domain-containing protein [Chroococcus sp. FPU101]|uniref:S-layer homology domain-containing protein n=1 Tax=Chroococcus sp. FPU101 TaxID=1974212 RepID=UPI001A8C4502|nr:S-layer homology domain-containing protein [Chroococcus sp. FPU101]GFE70425.1 S-layer domain-containing protein [Chroococcus sp. FPU101]
MNLPPPNPPPNRRDSLKFDDFIGILVAFTSIGTILWWSFSQLERGFDSSLLPSLVPSPSQTATPDILQRNSERTETRTEILPTQKGQPSTTVLPQTIPSPTTSVIPVPLPPPKTTEVVKSSGFSDVPSNYWASPFIAAMVERGIMQGFPDNTFRPEEPVTRVEFADMLQRAFNRSKTRSTVDFKDVPSGDNTTPAIDQAVQMEFMKGYPGQVFRPDQPISKAESLVALANGLKLTNTSTFEQVNSIYQDAEQIPRYAMDEVAAATTAGIVVNHPESRILAPQQIITRAEAAALVYQALVKAGQAEKIDSPYLVQP